MKLSILSTLLTAAVPAVLTQDTCTPEQRVNTLKSITTAFNAKAPGESAKLIQAFPLQRDCPAIVFVTT